MAKLELDNFKQFRELEGKSLPIGDWMQITQEMINDFAKATTAYTRSQAHAMQVYEALVPPSTSPADLGLKPFGADWATWETKVGKIK